MLSNFLGHGRFGSGGVEAAGDQPVRRRGGSSRVGPMISVLTFRLTGGADERQFLLADRRMQEDFAYQQSGLQRRTTARGREGEWLVLELWASQAAADDADAQLGSDPVAQEFMAFVDPTTMRRESYSEVS